MNLLDLMVRIGVDDQASPEIGGIASGITGKLGQAAKVVGTAIVGATAAAGAGVVAIGKAAVDGYASYEQLTGGVAKLYGSGQTLIAYAQEQGKAVSEVRDEYNALNPAVALMSENASKAWQTAGMSANQYMEQATSFSAALIGSLGGDTAKAAEQADVAMRAMSDNVNTFGSNMGDVQNAFQGFAKQNYTMLDNLKLGYGGTKEEMQRLIDDANAYAEANGKAADLSIDSFSDIVTAIQLIQEKQHIAGTTAKEAMSTIEGSWNAAKASWDNLLVAIGSGDGEMVSQSVTGLVDSIFGTFSEEAGKREGGLVNNLLPVLQNVGNAFMQQLPTIAGQLVEAFVTTINGAFGTDFQVDGISQAFTDMSTKAQEAFDQIGQIASGFWAGFSSTFDSGSFQSTFENIQSIAGQVFDFLSENSDEIGAAFGIAADVLGTVADAITTVVDALGPFLPLIAGAAAALAGFSAIQPIIALVTGAFTTMTTVVIPALGMVQSFGGAIALVTTLLGGPIPILIAVAGAVVAFVATNEDARQAILDAWNAVVGFFTGVLAAIGTVIQGIITWFQQLPGNIASFLGGVISSVASWVGEMASNAASAGSQFVNAVGTFFGQLPGRVGGFLMSVINIVVSWVSQMASNAISAGSRFLSGIGSAMASLPGRIGGFLSSALGMVAAFAGSLATRAVQAGQGFLRGIQGGFQQAVSFVGGIPGRIRGAIGNLGGLLVGAGRSVMDGLLSGLRSGFGAVQGFVGGIAGWIASHKGPIEYDRRLLIPNGMAIMAGLGEGLERAFGSDVVPLVSGLGSRLADAMATGGPGHAWATSRAGSPYPAPARTTVVNQSFNTRVVRSDQDMYAAATILSRSAMRTAMEVS